jgi:chemotaxis signal transduction protein
MSTVQVRSRVGREQYALAVEHVRSVVDTGELTPVPGSPENVLGLRNLNGEILPAFDLARILGIERDGRPARLLVCEYQGQQAAFAVDEVLDVGPATATMQESDSCQLDGSMVIDGVMVGVLAIGVLFDSIAAEDQR